MTFDEAMILTRTVSSPAAFEDDECHAYFDILMTLPENALIVEVGLEYGRSSSIALQVAKDKTLRYVGIDPFSDEEVYAKWLDMAHQVGFDNMVVVRGKSASSRIGSADLVSAILIDGDHSYNAVLDDCSHFLPLVERGGYALFHDYGRDSLPEVTQAVDDYFVDEPTWKWYRQVGTLGIWGRL